MLWSRESGVRAAYLPDHAILRPRQSPVEAGVVHGAGAHELHLDHEDDAAGSTVNDRGGKRVELLDHVLRLP